MVFPENNSRVSKIDTYLNCAEIFAYRSTCLKENTAQLLSRMMSLSQRAITARREALKTAVKLARVREWKKICTKVKAMESAEPFTPK